MEAQDDIKIHINNKGITGKVGYFLDKFKVYNNYFSPSFIIALSMLDHGNVARLENIN